jgi:lipopolysaccharide export LptBFGC system permease protein LptF
MTNEELKKIVNDYEKLKELAVENGIFISKLDDSYKLNEEDIDYIEFDVTHNRVYIECSYYQSESNESYSCIFPFDWLSKSDDELIDIINENKLREEKERVEKEKEEEKLKRANEEERKCKQELFEYELYQKLKLKFEQ